MCISKCIAEISMLVYDKISRGLMRYESHLKSKPPVLAGGLVDRGRCGGVRIGQECQSDALSPPTPLNFCREFALAGGRWNAVWGVSRCAVAILGGSGRHPDQWRLSLFWHAGRGICQSVGVTKVFWRPFKMLSIGNARRPPLSLLLLPIEKLVLKPGGKISCSHVHILC